MSCSKSSFSLLHKNKTFIYLFYFLIIFIQRDIYLLVFVIFQTNLEFIRKGFFFLKKILLRCLLQSLVSWNLIKKTHKQHLTCTLIHITFYVNLKLYFYIWVAFLPFLNKHSMPNILLVFIQLPSENERTKFGKFL